MSLNQGQALWMKPQAGRIILGNAHTASFSMNLMNSYQSRMVRGSPTDGDGRWSFSSSAVTRSPSRLSLAHHIGARSLIVHDILDPLSQSSPRPTLTDHPFPNGLQFTRAEHQPHSDSDLPD
jgi:hypothetical protein